MFKGQNIFCLAMICGLAFAGTTVAQEADFFVVITDSEDPVEPNSSVNFEVEVANAGPDDSTLPVILDITLPMGVPVPFQEYLQADEDGRTAIVDMFLETAQFMVDDNIWDDGVSRILVGDSLNNGCAGLMIQLQQLRLPAGSSGVFYFDVTLPRSGGALHTPELTGSRSSSITESVGVTTSSAPAVTEILTSVFPAWAHP